jgi:uncharacterized protein
MTVPTFRELSPEECEALLAVNHVGRMAFTFKDRPDIEPIHYVAENGWIFGRTTQGTKLTTIGHHPYVAFEVDEVRGTFDWRSVVALGTVYLLDPEFGTTHAAEYERAVELLRRFMPKALREGDPVPFRTVVFGIHVDELRGREATVRRRRRAQRARASA